MNNQKIGDNEIAVSVDKLYKDFKLPHDKKNSIKEKVLFFNKKTTYDKLHALRDINFEVKKGEFFGIVGRNGSGKSTLLKIIGGIYQPTKGALRVNGTLTPFIELGIGFNPELTGRENIFLNGAILGLTRKEIIAKYDEIVEFAELENFMDQKLKNYSSGMQVRLAFSIAIQAHNDILLIDEVLAVGDTNFQRKCLEVFKKIKNSGKTVIFVSHDMNTVKEFCDRAILIEKSKIITEGDPNKVANSYIDMFNNSYENKINLKDRWGDQKLTISEAEVSYNEKELRVSYEIDAHEDAEKPIFGVIIRDASNNNIIDSNTKWNSINTGIVVKNSKIKITWIFDNILKSGTYTISPAAAYSDGLAFYDWQDNAIKFTVNRNAETAGLVLTNQIIKIKDAS